ncbi:hypothetical protein ABPG75_009364 [Micractinium tetrahymenae]
MVYAFRTSSTTGFEPLRESHAGEQQCKDQGRAAAGAQGAQSRPQNGSAGGISCRSAAAQQSGPSPAKRPAAKRQAPGAAVFRPAPATARPAAQQGSPAQRREGLKQTAATARTERLRSALQQLRAAKTSNHGGASDGAGSGSSNQATAAAVAPAVPQAVLMPQPGPASPLRSQAPPLAQHPAASCSAQLGADFDPDLDDSLEDLFDEASLSLLARLRLGSTQRGGMLPAAQDSSQPVLSAHSSARAAAHTARVHDAARQALRQAAGDEELPEQQMLAARAASAMQVASSSMEHQAESAAEVQQRLEHLRSTLRSPCVPVQPQSAGASAVKPAGATSSPDSVVVCWPSGALGLQPPPRRLAAGELVLTRAPCTAAAATAAAAAPAALTGYSTGLQSELALLQHSPRRSSTSYVSRNSGSSAGGAAARLAALLGQPAEQRQTAAAHPIALGAGRVQPWASLLLPWHQSNGSAEDCSCHGLRPGAKLQTAAGGPAMGAGTAALMPAVPPQLAAAAAAVPAAHAPLPPGSAAAGSPAAGGSGGDILEAWRSRRRAAQAQPLADKYARFLMLQQQGAQQQQQQQQQGGQQQSSASMLQQAAGLLRAEEQHEPWPHQLAAGGSPQQGSRQLALPRRSLSACHARANTAAAAGRATQLRLALGQASQQLGKQQGSPSRQQARPQLQLACQAAPAAAEQAGGGDILERWRARHRQQGQACGRTDYSALLTLQPPLAVSPGRPTLRLQAPLEGGPLPALQAAASAAAAAEAASPAVLPVSPAAAATVRTTNAAAPAPAAPEAESPTGSASARLERLAQLVVSTGPAVPAGAGWLGSTEPESADSPCSRAAVDCDGSGGNLPQESPRAASAEVEGAVAAAATAPATVEAAKQPDAAEPAGAGELPAEAAPSDRDAAGTSTADSTMPTASSVRSASRPSSAAGSSGRATPQLGWARNSANLRSSVGSACWSPGMSQMLDDVIGGLLFASGDAGQLPQPGRIGSAQAGDEEVPPKDGALEPPCSSSDDGSPAATLEAARLLLVAATSELEGLPSGVEASDCLQDAETAGWELPAAAAAVPPAQLVADGAASVLEHDCHQAEEAAERIRAAAAESPET